MKLPNLLLASAALFFVPPPAPAQRPELVIQTGHSRAVQSAAFSPDGRLLATASGDDETVRIWEVATGREMRALAADNAAEKVAFSPDGATLYSGGRDRVVAWNVRTGRELRRFADGSGGRNSALSEDGRLLAIPDPQGIKIWDSASGQEVRRIEVGKRFYNALAFSPDGKTLAAGNGSNDGIIDFWDVASGALVRSLHDAHSAYVTGLAFGADARTLVSAGGDRFTRVWDVSRGKALHSFRGQTGLPSFTLSPDRKILASCDVGGVELRDLATGRTITRVGSALYLLALFHPEGRDLLVGDHERLTLLSGDGWREAQVFRGRASAVTSVAFGPDGKTLGSGQTLAVRAFKLWSAGEGREFRSLKCLTDGPESVFFSPDGRWLACGSGDLAKSAIHFWDVKAGVVVRSFTGHSQSADSLAFSPDGGLLALESPDNKEFKLWEVTTGKLLRQFAGHSSRTAQIAFSPDGKHLVSSGLDSGDDVIKIWEVSSGRELRKFVEAADVNSPFAVSPDGRVLAVWDPWNGGVNLLDMETGARVRTMEGAGTASVEALAFSPDGLLLASGDWNGSIRLWKTADGTLRHTLSGHANVVQDLAFSPDGKLLLSGGRDTKTILWDVAAGRELMSLLALDAEDWLAVTPDGLFDGTPAAWRQILWRFNGDTFDVAPVEAYFNEFYYPGLLTDILSGLRPHAAQDIAQRERRQPHVRLSPADAQAADRSATPAREINLRVHISEPPAAGGAQRASVGARDVRLFRNGSLVRAWRGDVLGGRDAATLDATVPLVAGENAFTAYAFIRSASS